MTLKPKYQRLLLLSAGLAIIAYGVFLLLRTFEDNLVYFYSPTDLVTLQEPLDNRRIRIGGLVKEGTLQHNAADLVLKFIATDNKNDIAVTYQGTVPALFREGQGVVVEGRWVQSKNNGMLLQADRILTKHDENYMPPEVARALKEDGIWKEEKLSPAP